VRLPAERLRRSLALVRGATGRSLVAAVLGAGAVLAAVGLLATAAWLISRAAQHPSVQSLAVAVVGVRFFGLSRGFLRYAERLVGHDAALRALGRLRVRVYASLDRLAPAGLSAFRSGDLLSRLVADVDTLQDLLLRVFQPCLVAVLAGGVTVVLSALLLPSAGAVLAVTLVIAGLGVPAVSRRMARRSEARLASLRGELSQTVVDLVQGAPDLVAYGAVPGQLALATGADAELAAAARAGARTSGVGLALTSLLTGACVWGAAVLGIAAVSAGRLPGVQLAVVVLIPLAAFESVAGLPAAAQAMERVRHAADRVLDVVERPAVVVDPEQPTEPRQSTVAGAPAVSVRGLVASWPGADRPALVGVNLDLSPGRRVAVVGPSGAGKSTLAYVLLRLLPYQSGSVTLDGIELDALAGDDVRRAVGLAAQDAHVFDATLEENLRLARPVATDEELRVALEASRLGPWLDSLPQGLATRLGERGRAISGGQRQRLALARALLADFPVLVLDEPGDHLDTETADRLTADLLAATAGRSTLLVTHRLAGLTEVDEVVVLDAGRVVERGSHLDLLARPGRYAELWQRERAAEQAS
jgi:thiol reductant ABC exporter CydC subunit